MSESVIFNLSVSTIPLLNVRMEFNRNRRILGTAEFRSQIAQWKFGEPSCQAGGCNDREARLMQPVVKVEPMRQKEGVMTEQPIKATPNQKASEPTKRSSSGTNPLIQIIDTPGLAFQILGAPMPLKD
jgi:hypothetical protein